MNKEKKQYSPKYWVVHSETSTDVLIHTLSKNKQDSINKFLDSVHVMVGTMSEDDVGDWRENQHDTDFVCSLIEIKLVEV